MTPSLISRKAPTLKTVTLVQPASTGAILHGPPFIRFRRQHGVEYVLDMYMCQCLSSY